MTTRMDKNKIIEFAMEHYIASATYAATGENMLEVVKYIIPNNFSGDPAP